VEALADRVAIIRKGMIAEEGDPKQQSSLSMQHVHVRFAQPIQSKPFEKVPGVHVLDAARDKELTLQVEGSIDALVKALAAHEVLSIETSHLTLEEVFLAYYKNGNQKEQQS